MRRRSACCSIAVFAATLIATAPAGAALAPREVSPSAYRAAAGVVLPDCACGAARPELLAHRDAIANASSVAEARDLALSQTRLARQALSRAALVLPFSERIGETRHRLAAFEERVRDARTQAEVADRFGTFVGIASDDGAALPPVSAGGGCHYSKGDIVIVLIGLLFGVLPGIIFLILLC